MKMEQPLKYTLSQDEAINFIETNVVNHQDSCELIEYVGKTRLALLLATAYIRQNRTTISAYIKDFRKFSKTDQCNRVLEKVNCDESEAKLYRAILFSVCSIKHFLSGKAGLLLFLCSYLNSNNIPLHLFDQEELMATKPKLLSSSKLLLSYKLLSQETDDRSIMAMDSTIQRAIRDYLFVFHNHEELVEGDHDDDDTDLYDDILRPLSNALIVKCPENCSSPEEFSDAYLFTPHMKSFGMNVWQQSKCIQNKTKDLFVDLAEDVLDTSIVAMIQSRMFFKAVAVGDVLLELKGIKYGTKHEEVTRILANIGIITNQTGDALKAVAIFEKVLEMEEKHYGRDHLEIANTLDHYIGALNELQHYSKAREMGARAMNIKERELGKNSDSAAKTMAKLASALDGLGKMEEAKDLFQKSLEIMKECYSADSIQCVEILENLSQTLFSLGELDSSLDMLEKVLNIKKLYYHSDHIEIAQTLRNMCNAILENNPPKAKELCEQALVINKNAFGEISLQVARSQADMGSVLRKCGEFRGAEKMYQASLQTKEKLLGSQHIEMASTMNNFSVLEIDLGDRKYAHILLEKAKKICQQNGESGNSLLEKVNENLKQFKI